MKSFNTLLISMISLSFPSLSFAQSYIVNLFEKNEDNKIQFILAHEELSHGHGMGNAIANGQLGVIYNIGNSGGVLEVKISDTKTGLEYESMFSSNSYVELDDRLSLLIERNDGEPAIVQPKVKRAKRGPAFHQAKVQH